MNKKIFLLFAAIAISSFVVYNNCGGFQSSTGAPAATATNVPFPANSVAKTFSAPLPITGNEPNVMPLTVGCGYTNEPCVSVTICQPGAAVGSSSCVTINNVLLDTGSSGLRLFSSLIPANITLSPATINGLPIGECLTYADNTSDWGPEVYADVYLGNGNEHAPNVPIQLINASYATVPADCPTPDIYSLASGNADNVGYNGVLGVGLFAPDCGDNCASDPGNETYFTCSGSNCSGVAVPDNLQVTNPVALINSTNASGKLDNNGVILQFPNISSAGATTLNGFAILGIGTQADNTPGSSVTFFQADSLGNFETYYGGMLFSDSTVGDGAFIDSGSNALYFQDNTLTQCSVSQGFYCPAALTSEEAVQSGANATPNDIIPFQVANADAELAQSNPNVVFNNLSGTAFGAFDWGLPFFLGKTVYVGLSGSSSPLGVGPYWAF